MLEDKRYRELLECVKKKLDLSRELEDEEVALLIDETVMAYSRNEYLEMEERVNIARQIFNAIRRLDILQPYIEDDTITEIMVNGEKDIFIEREGKVVKVATVFESKQKLEDVVQNIVAKINRVVNEKSPICDARLLEGSRVSIVLPPVALNGPILTIRKFAKEVIKMEQLIGWQSITEEAATFLEKLIRSKYNIFICGGTGSGKTTLLNVLSNYINSYERIVTIEDSAELQITAVDNIVKLETRNNNVQDRGAITIRDLIKAALRMRPDRIIVGEVRGKEAVDMLQAMNTGHDGSLSTGHANSPKDMLNRLETMILTGENVPLAAIQKQIASSIDIIVQVSRMRDGTRKITEIVEVLDCIDGKIRLSSLFKFEEDRVGDCEQVKGRLRKTEQVLQNQWKLSNAGIEL